MDQSIEDYIVNFLARKESPEDVQKLKEWLSADPAHRDELKQILAVWDTANMAGAAGKISVNEAYRRFMFRLYRETSTEATRKLPDIYTVYRTIRRIAAIFAVSFSLGVAFHYYWVKNQPEQTAFIESIVPLGAKSEIKLPDGSTVWLNAGSKLRYPTSYGRISRDIWLEGEGYFKVAKQPEKPFMVHTAWSNIRALGTEFNVKAYPGEGRVETTLIKGEVAVEKGEAGGNIDRTVLLKPGQKLLVAASKEVTEKPEEAQQGAQPAPQALASNIQPVQSIPVIKQLAPAIAEAEVSWKERNWRIESEPLQDLSVKIERRYDVSIRVDEPLKNYRFTGTVKDESLEQVLHAMQLTAPIRFMIEGKQVFIRVDTKKMK